MYRVTMKVGGSVYSKDFTAESAARSFYNKVRASHKNVWFFDLTDKPTHDKVGTVDKVFSFLDKLSRK